MVLRTQPWRAFTGAAIVQCYLVGRSDGRPGVRCDGNHLSIARVVRLSVKGFADDEEGARAAGAVPTCPWSLPLTESQLDTQAVHHCTVEAQGALEIADAYKTWENMLAPQAIWRTASTVRCWPAAADPSAVV